MLARNVASVRAALKKLSLILKECLQAADNILSMREQLIAIDEQLNALYSDAIEPYFTVPDNVIQRTVSALKKKEQNCMEKIEKEILVIDASAKKLMFLPGQDVEDYLVSKPDDIIRFNNACVVRCATIYDWFMQSRDLLAREAVMVKRNHAHALFSFAGDSEADSLLPLILDTVALLDDKQ